MLHATVMAALAFAQAAPLQDAPALQRVGKWQIDDDGEACHLAAQFGEGANAVVARFTRYAGGDGLELQLLGPQFDHPTRYAQATYDFGIGKPVTTPVSILKAEKGSLMTAPSLRIDGADSPKPGTLATRVGEEQEGKVSMLTVSVPKHATVRLATGSLQKPMAAFRTCVDNLVQHWGYDPVALKSLSKPAVPLVPASQVLTSADYPASMARSDMNGSAQYRIGIDEAGAVSSCHVLYQDEKAPFAEATCTALRKRAKFTPALDAQGKPIKAYMVGRTIWRMGGSRR
jgi:hypothetical protein